MNTSLGMATQSPLIDTRKHQQLIEQLNMMVPYYTPEWKFNEDDPDFGSALALMFLHLLEGNIQRLNQIPNKSYLTFLNHFNVERAPATSAIAQVTFKLAEGTPQSVFIDKGIQLSANSMDSSDPIVFETSRPALLTTAKLQQIVAVYPRKDRVIVHRNDGVDISYSHSNEQEPTIALYGSEGLNIQEHTVYIAHDFLFLVHEPACMELTFIHRQHESALLESVALLADLDKVVWEYYSDGQWVAFDAVHSHGAIIRLLKLRHNKLQQTVVEDKEAYWIRCRALSLSDVAGGSAIGKVQFERVIMKTDYAAAKETIGMFADRTYFNDMAINTIQGAEPFGDFFAPYGLFYIGSEETLSKRGALVTISFQLEYNSHRLFPNKPKPINWKPIMKRDVLDKVEQPDIVTITHVQWEYWNGRSWVQLEVADTASTMFNMIWDGKQTCELSFVCPLDMESTDVNSELNYWIRGRIVSVNNAYSIDAVYYSPSVSQLQLNYKYAMPLFAPEQFITLNNLELRDHSSEMRSGGMPFRPFQPLSGYQPTVWFGFDQAPTRGPIHLYIDMVTRNWTSDEIPHIQWEYLRSVGTSAVWTPLAVADETQGFTQSGMIQFVGPQDFAHSRHYGKQAYWLRAINRDTRYYASNEQLYEPRVKQILLNTLTVLQQMTIEGELPSFVDGYHIAQDVHASYYGLSLTPVLSEEVWVDETDSISSHELSQLQLDIPHRLMLLHDSEQQLMKVWIRYEHVDQFLRSKPTDRHYRIDRAAGRITFGDGKQGRAVSIVGDDQVKVNYISGGGSRGNVGRREITTMQNAIAYVDSVYNAEEAAGGCNAGTIQEAMERGSKGFAHRKRAVIAEDFEWMTKEAHPNVAKVKCLPNRNVKLEKELGALTIIVMPQSGRRQGAHFQELKKAVEHTLLQATAASIAFPNKLQVIEPVYLEIGVRATIWVRNMDEVVQVERELLLKLEQFLHPLTGNTDGYGWEIGGMIHPSMFYALMKSVGPVVHIPQLLLESYKLENGERSEWNPDRIDELPHSIVIPGQHRLTIELHQ